MVESNVHPFSSKEEKSLSSAASKCSVNAFVTYWALFERIWKVLEVFRLGGIFSGFWLIFFF